MKFKHLLRPLHLTAIMFFTVSGGPYGLEPLLHSVGSTLAVVLILVTPLVWSLPVILVVLELNGIMPQEGGYYQWVKSALGRSWGFCEGWWSWLYAMTDLAIYPVLFVQYISFFFPQIAPYSVAICLGMVWLCTLLNLKGILPVGRSSLILGVFVIAPFVVMAIVGMTSHPNPGTVRQGLGTTFSMAALCMGLFNVMWNYLGWDNGFTIAEEVRSPVRAYPIAIAGAMVLIAGTYLVSMLTGIRFGIDPQLFEENGFPALGAQVGGWWLGSIVAAGGMASALGLFLAGLLAISRVPNVMSDDGYLPRFLRARHPVTQMPTAAILTCAVVTSCMVVWSFGELLVIDVTLYTAALMPEFAALIALRRRAPNIPRPFRVPLGSGGLIGLTALPVICIGIALSGLVATGTVNAVAAWVALLAVASGPAIWLLLRRSGRPLPSGSSAPERTVEESYEGK